MLARPAFAIAALLALAAGPGCGRPQARPVRIVLSLSGGAGRPVHGVDLTVALPPGTTIAHDASTGRISAHALSLRAGEPGATIDGRFVAHASAPSARILVASRAPLRDGELASFEATVRSAVAPSVVRFEVARSAVWGADGATVPGASGWVSAADAR